MAIGYDGKQISGYMGCYIALVDKFKANDPGVTKDTFVQLAKDLEVFRDANAALGFGQKAPLKGTSAKLGFPDMTGSEVQAILTKIRTTILKG